MGSSIIDAVPLKWGGVGATPDASSAPHLRRNARQRAISLCFCCTISLTGVLAWAAQHVTGVAAGSWDCEPKRRFNCSLVRSCYQVRGSGRDALTTLHSQLTWLFVEVLDTNKFATPWLARAIARDLNVHHATIMRLVG